jgi:hypothetical protein
MTTEIVSILKRAEDRVLLHVRCARVENVIG